MNSSSNTSPNTSPLSIEPVERVPTGIHGLDGLLEGGLPRGRVVALAGPDGAGKTTFGFQFLLHGITAGDEPGVYVTLEEEVLDLQHDMGRYGWELARHAAEGKLAIVKSAIPFEADAPLSVDALLDEIRRAVAQVGARRIVFDSMTALALPYGEAPALRRDVLRLCAALRESGCTALLITGAPPATPAAETAADERGAASGLEQLAAQGTILLHLAQSYRGLEIRKMRGTRHDTSVHRLRITERGLVVSPGEHPF